MKQDMIAVVDLGSTRNTDVARAVRALGVYSEICNFDVTAEELKALPNLRGIIANGGPNSDAILREEFAANGLEGKVWQYFTIVPDFKSVGVRDNARCFDWPVIIRAVNTIDAMTAEVPELPWAVLQKITCRILAEVPTVNRVCFDLSPKPTATIEWE